MKIKVLSRSLIIASTLLFNTIGKADMCPNPKTITIKNCNDIQGDIERKTCIFSAGTWEYPQTTEEESINPTEEALKNNLYKLYTVEIPNSKDPLIRCNYKITDLAKKPNPKNLIFLRKKGKFIPSTTSEWDKSKPKFVCHSKKVNECQFELLKN